MKYIEYSTENGLRKHRAVINETNVELYDFTKDIWDNPYWRFMFPISHITFFTLEL